MISASYADLKSFDLPFLMFSLANPEISQIDLLLTSLVALKFPHFLVVALCFTSLRSPVASDQFNGHVL